MKNHLKFPLLFLLLNISALAFAQTVTVDNFFNREYRKGKDGKQEVFHYTWDDKTFSGYSIFGDIFRRNGFALQTLQERPVQKNLKGTDVYILVDPDTQKETPNPNYIEDADIKNIAAWVHAGGILLLFANDSANVELKHLNKLSETFGIHFNNDLRNRVTGDQFDMAAFSISPGDPVFKTARKIYIKEICTLQLSGAAKSALSDGSDVIMAIAPYGKGTVFAVGDPWFYNEYCNGRLPAGFDNDKAADDLVKWAKKQKH